MTTYSYKIELTDYAFLALENLLIEECEKIKTQYGIVAYDPDTGETKHTLGVILKAMQDSKVNATLNSYTVRLGRP